MIRIEQVRVDAKRQAVKSARAHQVPYTPCPEDYDDVRSFTKEIPFLGERKQIRDVSGPPLWIRGDVREYFPDYPYKWFFVDSSGWGERGARALTIDAFVAMAKAYQAAASKRGFITGFGIAEAGQFQVHIAAYLRKLRAANPPTPEVNP